MHFAVHETWSTLEGKDKNVYTTTHRHAATLIAIIAVTLLTTTSANDLSDRHVLTCPQYRHNASGRTPSLTKKYIHRHQHNTFFEPQDKVLTCSEERLCMIEPKLPALAPSRRRGNIAKRQQFRRVFSLERRRQCAAAEVP